MARFLVDKAIFYVFGPRASYGQRLMCFFKFLNSLATILDNHDNDFFLICEKVMSFHFFYRLFNIQINPHYLNLESKLDCSQIDVFEIYDCAKYMYGTTGSIFAGNGIINLYFSYDEDRTIVDDIQKDDWIKESHLCLLANGEFEQASISFSQQ